MGPTEESCEGEDALECAPPLPPGGEKDEGVSSIFSPLRRFSSQGQSNKNIVYSHSAAPETGTTSVR